MARGGSGAAQIGADRRAGRCSEAAGTKAAMAGYVPGLLPADRSQEKEFVQAYEDVLERYKGTALRGRPAGPGAAPGCPRLPVAGPRCSGSAVGASERPRGSAPRVGFQRPGVPRVARAVRGERAVLPGAAIPGGRALPAPLPFLCTRVCSAEPRGSGGRCDPAVPNVPSDARGRFCSVPALRDAAVLCPSAPHRFSQCRKKTKSRCPCPRPRRAGPAGNTRLGVAALPGWR